MSYHSKFTGKEIERRLDLVIDIEDELDEQYRSILTKQDIITDLQSIREGAAKGQTALQNIPEEYIMQLNNKQDNITDLDSIREGAQLGSTALQQVPAASTVLGLVKQGGDCNISNGVITVKDDSHNHIISNIDNLQTVLDQKVSKTTTINGKALSENITLTASDLGIDVNDATDATLVAAKQYTDNKVAALVNGAPETLDTLDEIAAALDDNNEIMDALTDAIGKKQDVITDLSTIRDGASKGATAVQSVDISDMLTRTDASVIYQPKITQDRKLDYSLISNAPTSLSQFTDDVVNGNYVRIGDNISKLKNDANYITDDLPEDGVYAVKSDGSLVNVDEADTSCVAVALIVNSAPIPQRIMIEKNETTNAAYNGITKPHWNLNRWDMDEELVNYTFVGGGEYTDNGYRSYGYLPNSNGEFGGTPNLSSDYTTWTSGALSDFNGKNNTIVMTTNASDAKDSGTILKNFNAASDLNQGYSDWYIPSCGQMALMWLNIDKINNVLTTIGGQPISSDGYLTSSEFDSYGIWAVNFESGRISGGSTDSYCDKMNGGRYRFIRDLEIKPLKDRVRELEEQVKLLLEKL